ncbi:MAG: hypothetical protein AAF721_25565 [Myxococcota bacterium]
MDSGTEKVGDSAEAEALAVQGRRVNRQSFALAALLTALAVVAGGI